MEGEEAEPQEQLDLFIREWRRELDGGGRGGEGRKVGRRDSLPTSWNKEEEVREPARKRLAPREPSPLLVLPAGGGVREEGKREEEGEGRRAILHQKGARRLLDTLIADLVGVAWGHMTARDDLCPLDRMRSTLYRSLRCSCRGKWLSSYSPTSRWLI